MRTRCTYHLPYKPRCNKPEDDPIHVRPEERMRPGCHVYRVELTRQERKEQSHGRH